MKFVILRNKKNKQQFRYQIVGGNGRNIGPVEGYTRRASVLKTIRRIKKDAANAPIVEA